MSSIRVISGRFGGRKLDAPSEGNTRTKPMGERIRNALFNSIGAEIQDARVLDAFAGTGSVGIEALSRGAEFVTFVERDNVAGKILINNIFFYFDSCLIPSSITTPFFCFFSLEMTVSGGNLMRKIDCAH